MRKTEIKQTNTRKREREREYETRKNENQNGNLCIVERTYISILRFTCQIGNINFEVEPRKRNTYRPKNTLIDNELNYTINCKRKDDGDDGTEKKVFLLRIRANNLNHVSCICQLNYGIQE